MAPKQLKAGKKSKKEIQKVVKKPKKVVEESDSDEDESDDDSEEEVAVPVTAKANGRAKAAAQEDSEEESDEEDSDEDEEPPKKGAIAAAADSDEEDSDVEEDSDEEGSDEEIKKAPKGKAPLAEMEVDEDSDEEDSEEEEEEEEEDEEENEIPSKKRKAQDLKKSAKKAKVEEVVSIKVSNLPEGSTDEKIVKWFKKRGVSTVGFRRNVKRGYGFLDLEDAETLSTALALSGEEFKGSELTVEKAEPRKPDKPEKTPQKTPQKGAEGGQRVHGEEKDKLTLFIKNFPFEVEEEQIQEAFPEATEVRLARKPDGSLKGFGFVQFNTEAEVDEAMEEKQGTEIGGRAIMLDYCGGKAKNNPSAGFNKPRDPNASKGEAGKSKVLFVGNLSFDTTEDSLKDAFDGSASARVLYRDDGRPKGIGFVEFDNADDAKKAFDAMSGQEVDGRQINLDFATERRNDGGGRGGFRGGRGGRGGGGGFGGRGGRGGFGDRGGRGGFGDRGGRGGFGDRGGRGFGDRGGRGRGGGRGGFQKRDGIQNFRGTKKSFDD